MHKRFLIAGGAGFLGCHIVKRLLQLKHVEEVVVLDNFSTGSFDNLADFHEDPRLKVITTDISKTIPDLKGGFDYIWHLAALANPADYEKNPVNTLSVNSDGNKNLIELARKFKAQYIYFSSSEVYGLYDQIPPHGFNEAKTVSHLILGKTRSPYPIGKCFGEEYTRHLCNLYRIKFLIIRPFNVYGPKMDVKSNYGRVIPNFITWALKKEPLQINGDGTQIRTFCYIDDFVNAIFMLLEQKSLPVVINIGSQQPTRIIDLAQLINQMLGNDSNNIFVKKYLFEPLVRIPDLSLIKSITDWEQETGLKDGLQYTINWIKTTIKAK